MSRLCVTKHLYILICALLFPALSSGHFGDPKHLVEPAEILTWTDEQRLEGFRSYSNIFPTARIPAGGREHLLTEETSNLDNLIYQVGTKNYSLDQFITNTRVAGLIVVHKGKILYERYELGNNQSTLWVSYSIAKSVVSMLFGAAIADGFVETVNDPIIKYLPEVGGGAYNQVTIEQLLQMSSGVSWREDYVDPSADVSKSPSEINALVEYMSKLPIAATPGSKFNYSTGETNLAGAVLRSAIGMDLSSYLSQKIWQPFGMERDANWMLGANDGIEYGGCCISATLRNYARLGLFSLQNTNDARGISILPKWWMKASTTPSPNNTNYGYFWWLRDDGSYAALGIYGQMIWVDPKLNLVIAIHSAWPEASSLKLSRHRWAVIEKIADRIRKRPSDY